MHSHPHRRRGGTALSAALLALLMVVGLVVPAAAAPPDKAEKVDFTLTVLHNNDGESDLLPDEDGAGSISRFGWLLQDLRTDALRGPTKARGKTGVVAITSGDNFLVGPELQASLDKGVPWYDSIALDHIGYDGFTIGNHEFDLGPAGLADFIAGFKGGDDVFLTANLDFANVPELQALVDAGLIRPSTVVKERGELIGIIGLTTPELQEVTSPGATIINDDLAGVVQEEVEALTAQGVDKILLSSHLQDIDEELDLVTQLSGVDAVIGGGGGETIDYPLSAVDTDGDVVPVVTVPGDYFDVGRLVLEFDKAGEVIGFGGALEPVTGDLPQDQFLVDNVEAPINSYLETLAQTVIATSEVGLNGVRAEVRTRETNVGNLMADAHLAAATARAAEFGVNEPDVALQNGGGIRNDSIIGPGEITLLDTFDIAPFPNFVSVLEDIAVTDFVAAVEHGLSAVPDAEGFFGQWAGLTVTYDPAAPAGSRIVDLVLDDGTVVVSGGAIVSTEPVTIATIDFLAGGNDGYDMFETYDFTTLGISYQQALADYIEGLGTITAADYADPVDEGDRTRIIPVP
jgi:5'-nucleotidase/UDP-sugar diphosphatase